MHHQQLQSSYPFQPGQCSSRSPPHLDHFNWYVSPIARGDAVQTNKMSLHQRIPQSLHTRIAHLARPSRPRQPPSAPKSTPRTQTRTFRTTPKRCTNNPNPKQQASTASTTAPTTKLDRIITRLPKPLRGYTSRLRSAPLSHVVAFLILHELTAIIPLLALFGLFHYFTPISSWTEYILTRYGTYVSDGIARFERYFTRKGWFGFGEDHSRSQSPQETETQSKNGEVEGGGGQVKAQTAAQEQGKDQQRQQQHKEEVIRKWESGDVDGKYRILVEIALAYALTKALLPVRIVASVSATPWFAGVLARLRNITRIGRRKP